MSENEIGIEALKWWGSLQASKDETTGKVYRGDPKLLAQLRRATTPLEAMEDGLALNLARRLGFFVQPERKMKPQDIDRLERIAALATVLAHVREHAAPYTEEGDTKIYRKFSFSARLGAAKKGENSIMSPLRFSRLMAARNAQDLMREMRHAVKLAGNKANVSEISEFIYYWSDLQKVQWTYAYWQGGEAAPKGSQTNAETQDITTNQNS